MLSKVNRFHGHNSLSFIYRKGQTVYSPQVSLKFLSIKADKPNRVSVVVSRKVNKSAVVRNRIRRRLYELLRVKMPKLTQKVDLVITVHDQKLATMEPDEISGLIDQLLTKSGLIKPQANRS